MMEREREGERDEKLRRWSAARRYEGRTGDDDSIERGERFMKSVGAKNGKSILMKNNSWRITVSIQRGETVDGFYSNRSVYHRND